MGRTFATVCDPWDGNVHVTELVRGAMFSYTGQPVAGFTTTRNFGYAAPNVGAASWGGMIHR